MPDVFVFMENRYGNNNYDKVTKKGSIGDKCNYLQCQRERERETEIVGDCLINILRFVQSRILRGSALIVPLTILV